MSTCVCQPVLPCTRRAAARPASAFLRSAAGPSLFAKPLRTATHKAADRASRNASKVIVAAAAGSLAPSSPPRPASEPECSGPEGTYDKVVALGALRANTPLPKAIILSLLAGAYISFGAMMVLAVGASCPGLASSNPGLQRLIQGAFGLPMGLILVVLTGGELFTGNCMLMPLAYLEGQSTLKELLTNWIVSFFGNLAGSIAVVWLVGTSGLLNIAAPVNVAAAKTSLTFIQAFTRGIIANWLVCLGVWMTAAATSLPGKAVGAWFPVTAFSSAGGEHSVANMFSIPMGIFVAGEVSWKAFFGANLLPVVLGNITSGVFFCALAFHWCYGKKKSAAAAV